MRVKSDDSDAAHDAPMALQHPLIRIHAAAAGDTADDAVCGGCDGAPAETACAAQADVFGRRCAAPLLQGDPALVEQALAALRGVRDPVQGGDLVGMQLVQALRVEGGEAELTLTYPRGCGVARLMAEDAFQVLRRVLHDTDVYVLHAAT
ncbi:iron-sulfur cluster assembly protein [Rubrivivax sp. RP6-9]|uniref:iron-sulfur cluster assembly protein n=1 Tax=Rubrivivax sp. RP6-9 TaxID=3415750 RepID=UPI003CC687C2